MANSQLVLAIPYLAGLEVHRSLSSRGAPGGNWGCLLQKGGTLCDCGAGLGIGSVAHANFEVQESFHLPASLDSYLCLDRGRLQWVKHNLSTLCSVPVAWKTLR